MDKKALKILSATYWTSNGWKPEEEQVTPPEDFLYAKRAGVMFDPIRLSHEDIVRRALEVRGRIDPQVVADAFLASLSTRRLELRSALGSYAVLRHFPPHEHHDRRTRCPVCGAVRRSGRGRGSQRAQLRAVQVGWRAPRGADVRHVRPGAIPEPRLRPRPRDADIEIFRRILRTIESVPPDMTAPRLEKVLGGVFPSNKAEREILITILGYAGILPVPDHAGFLDGFVPSDERALPPQRFVDMGYPVCWWKGRYGIDRAALRDWFPALEV